MPPDPEPEKAFVVYYAGRVQGVGFRYTAESIAAGYKVCGYVRNLRDGRVELWAQGEAGEVGRFLEAVGARMRRSITHSHITSRPVDPNLDRFLVRRDGG